MKVLWWGRIGKAVQFIAALTIIAEIIGPERLRVLGNSLRKNPIYSLSMTQDSKIPLNTTQKIMGAFSNILAILPTLVILQWINSNQILLLIIIGVLSFIVISFVLVFIIFFALKLVNYLFIESLAWSLEKEYFSNIIKVISVVLILLGFHFDMLAS